MVCGCLGGSFAACAACPPLGILIAPRGATAVLLVVAAVIDSEHLAMTSSICGGLAFAKYPLANWNTT
jgi:CBS-domain-containing membrane protein